MPSKPCTFYVVRHGETEMNVAEIMQGHVDSPLTENGKAQAKQRALDLKDVPFDDCFSSDLGRAKATAEILAVEHQLAVKTTALLREMKFGRFEGGPVKRFRSELKMLLEARERMTHEERFITRLEEGIETDEELMARMITFLRQTALAFPGKTVLVVSHGAIIRALLIHLGFGSYQDLPPYSIKNLGYAVIESDGIEFEVTRTGGIEKTDAK